MLQAKGVRIREPGGPEVLEIGEHPVRSPGVGEILVRVEAAGLNRADILQRRGLYPAPSGAPADIPGLEYAGIVEEVGGPDSLWKRGDRVMGIVPGGAMSSLVTVPDREAIPIPSAMQATDAASIPEAFLTAFDGLFSQGGLRMGQHVLIHAVGSGVGTAALQLSLAAGAKPLGTSRTQEKLERCRDLGLEEGILVPGGAFASDVLRRTGERGVELVLDLVGGSYLEENLQALAPLGRLVAVGLLGGAKGNLSLGVLLQKRLSLVGTVLRTRPQEEKAALARRFSREALPLFEAGRLRPVVDAVFPFERIADAHRLLESNRTFGKVVLAW